MSDTETPELWTANEVCRYLKITRETLSRWHTGGKIPEGTRVGPHLRWKRQEILEWFEHGCPSRQDWERMTRAAEGR